MRALASHRFFAALEIHLAIITAFGLIYRWRTRKLPKADRAGTLASRPARDPDAGGVRVVGPLALFTLDSGSWETRGHDIPATPATEPLSVTDITGPQVMIPAARTVEAVRQLPAA